MDTFLAITLAIKTKKTHRFPKKTTKKNKKQEINHFYYKQINKNLIKNTFNINE